VARNVLSNNTCMDADRLFEEPISFRGAANWLAGGSGPLLLLVGASQRSAAGALPAVSSVPLLYRGITGHWQVRADGFTPPDNTTSALGGERGVHVRESIRLEVPLVVWSDMGAVCWEGTARATRS